MAQSLYRTLIDMHTMDMIQKHAENACLGGASHIRGRADRISSLSEDQMVGQLGEFALCRWLRNESAYWKRRKLLDKTPWKGDDGTDYPGLRVDVKTSLMRRNRDVKKYNLPVRPAERHPENFYVLALVEVIQRPTYVWLIGWARDKELPPAKETGIFKGAHILPASKLHDMSTLGETVGYYLPTDQGIPLEPPIKRGLVNG